MLRELPLVWRKAITEALPSNAFLRRDRGNALYVTNAHLTSLDSFTVSRSGKLCFLTPTVETIAALEDTLSADDFCRSVERFRRTPIAEETIVLFCQGIKCLETGENIEPFRRKLRQSAALALRGSLTGGGLYACGLLDQTIRQAHENHY